MFNLNKKTTSTAPTTVITGGTGNLGKVVTRAFLDLGHNVIITYRSDNELREVLDQNEDKKQQLDAVRIDVTDEASLDDLAQKIKQKYGSLENLICLVGGFAMGTLGDATAETFDKMMTLNVKSFLLTANALVPLMADTKKQKTPSYRHIIAVSSHRALEPSKNMGIYAASKAAIVTLVKTLSVELLDQNITVNAVAPSTIDTPQNRQSMTKADTSKWVSPQQVADSIVFLASERANPVSGTVIPVYGKA